MSLYEMVRDRFRTSLIFYRSQDPTAPTVVQCFGFTDGAFDYAPCGDGWGAVDRLSGMGVAFGATLEEAQRLACQPKTLAKISAYQSSEKYTKDCEQFFGMLDKFENVRGVPS